MQSKTTNISYCFAFFYLITADFKICHIVFILMCKFPQRLASSCTGKGRENRIPSLQAGLSLSS